MWSQPASFPLRGFTGLRKSLVGLILEGNLEVVQETFTELRGGFLVFPQTVYSGLHFGVG